MPFDAYTLYYVGQALPGRRPELDRTLSRSFATRWSPPGHRRRQTRSATACGSPADTSAGKPGELYGTAVGCFVLAMPNRYLPILQEGRIDSLSTQVPGSAVISSTITERLHVQFPAPDPRAFAVAGLVAAAGPVIIHLLNRRRFRVVNWAAMDFLLEALQRNRRILQLRDLLLLACTACVLLFGLAHGPAVLLGTTAGHERQRAGACGAGRG